MSCTEASGINEDFPIYTYPVSGDAAKMVELGPYAVSIKFVPDGDVENIKVGSNDYAVQAVICSNPVITLNNGYEVSFTVDYDKNEEVSVSNLDNWLGSETAKARLSV